ncbi:MAG: sigma 54-interacting transcriptional regulator [Peptostreptococcaceae bacterium]|nr:sigma 54-interacting transcriptional regulator [Peptostreptococcaceae bacterium]
MNKEEYIEIINALINIIDEGVYVVDNKGEGLFYNDAMAAMEKININEVLGKPFHKAFPGVPIGESTMFKATRFGQSTLNLEQTYKSLHGRNITTNNSTVPVYHNGKTVGAIEVAKDITHIKSLSNRILELEEIEETEPEPAIAKHKAVIKKYVFGDIIGENSELLKVVSKAKRAANSDASVIIMGETGTGKELFAQSLHYSGKRKNKPFMAQNCAALPETLLEGILFGTSKGGFTGAIDRPGLFEQANGGTLLLDEISAMSYNLQSKLLRVLQEEYIRRVGGEKDIPIDVRIVATVNESPKTLIEEGLLRKDLFYRLNVVTLLIPPLRKRKDDIELLSHSLIDKHCDRFGHASMLISERALKKLENYDYPGNVRELENIIMQAVSLSDGEKVLNEHMLSMPVAEMEAYKYVNSTEFIGGLDECLASLEKELIREALINKNGNITKAAEELAIKRQTLQHKMKKYKISVKM